MKAPTANIQAPEKLQIQNITILNRQQTRKINLRLLKQITKALLAELRIEEAELGINFVGTKEMTGINWKFLQHEGPTDIITFNHAESGKRKQLHGELFICLDEAIAQAKEFKTNWQLEIVRYVIHGILHLLGHDDLKPGLRRKMKREENRLLRHISKKISLAQIAGRSKISA